MSLQTSTHGLNHTCVKPTTPVITAACTEGQCSLSLFHPEFSHYSSVRAAVPSPCLLNSVIYLYTVGLLPLGLYNILLSLCFLLFRLPYPSLKHWFWVASALTNNRDSGNTVSPAYTEEHETTFTLGTPKIPCMTFQLPCWREHTEAGSQVLHAT